MKILTNIPALRYSGDYLKNINVRFMYANQGVFELAQSKPNIIITNHYHEAVAASKKYPDIIFVGKDLQYPNINYVTPDNLLDELSVLIKSNISYPQCNVAYWNPSGKENIKFINKLRFLGNVKIMGHGFCIDELDRSFPQRMTPSFYARANIVAASSIEEAYKAMFMGKHCIFNGRLHGCFDIERALTVGVESMLKNTQYNDVWQYSHTNVWADIFDLLDYPEFGIKLKEITNYERTS